MISFDNPGAPGSIRMPAMNQASICLTSSGNCKGKSVLAICAFGSSAIATQRAKSASDQTRPVPAGPFKLDIAISLVRSLAFFGAGNRIDTSLAASGRGFGGCGGCDAAIDIPMPKTAAIARLAVINLRDD